jgi:hypothetical protein
VAGGGAYPGGYCSGLCNATTGGCGGDGQCLHESAWGDNTGICYDGCTQDTQCRISSNYSCQVMLTSQVCHCRGTGEACSAPGQCCSASCVAGNCQ